LNKLPLSLYVHIPWCVQKCPYCDFNSHGLKSNGLPEKEYIAHLLQDLTDDLPKVNARPIESIFIGGGTPSLFSEQAIAQLLEGIKQRCNLSSKAEITLEANPGTIESGRFAGYAQAGVNRFSIGVQSFDVKHLKVLGRIHSNREAEFAIKQAKASPALTFNTDLMHGLPEQKLEDALNDLKTAISLAPPHISWYQLTIEPNTPFFSKPPALPEDDVLWDIQQSGHTLLEQAGYLQYEISAYAKPEHQCQHNLNYWRFGDYLGIGCGAHGKITNPDTGRIERTVKVKHPRGYMSLNRAYLDKSHSVELEERPFEFFMNRFRLTEACSKEDYETFTLTQPNNKTLSHLDNAIQQGLLIDSPKTWQVTSKGRQYLNTLLAEFI
jgi:oxygen-independent coproporphyrinogen-3 oxidase